MKTKVAQELRRRKRRMEKRIDKDNLDGLESPVMTASNIHYELGERASGTAHGGIGALHLMVQRLGLDAAIDRQLQLLKFHLPYHESDHVLNIAYNVCAGGTCLDHLERLRTDESYLDALGARRIPDPTTAGDFCRRFQAGDVEKLMDIFNETRIKVWDQQPHDFYEQAIIDADGTLVTSTAECKEGMDFNYQGEWGYHPLLVTLANTNEPLFIVNRPGNRPSHEFAFHYLDKSITLCRRAGFRSILLRGDTDFSQTAHLDRWNADGVRFIFGMDAHKTLVEIAETLPGNAWRRLHRTSGDVAPEDRRARPTRVKPQVVQERGYRNIHLIREKVAEFMYQPEKCHRAYRVVVVKKELEITQGQQELFEWDQRYFFYITNYDSTSLNCEHVVFKANKRCNQENTIEQLKNGVYGLTAPVDTLVSNWAYMVMATLAWSLKAWFALHVPEHPRWQEKHRSEKLRILGMEFSTFRHAFIQMPAQIVKSGRRLIFRLLSWNPWQTIFFRVLDQLALPMRR